MKILSIINTMSLEAGGPPVVLRNQKKIINRKEKIISIFLLKRLSLYYYISIFFFPKRKKKFFNFIKKFDIIHFHEVWNIKPIIIAYYARKLGIKYFYVGHGYLDPWSINQKLFQKKLFIKIFLQQAYNYSSAAFFSTLGEYEDVKKNLKINNCFIIPNGADLSNFDQKIYDDSKFKKKILFFGRLHKKKGIDIMLNSIKELPANFFDHFYFEITGPGDESYIKLIKEKIINYNLSKKVFVFDKVKKNYKIEYLKKSDVFILPSFEEGDSIALKEAMAIGLPVIISKQCRMNIIEDYEAGFLVETNSQYIKKTLLKLLNADLEQMGINARNLIKKEYDNEECSRRLYDIYVDILTGSFESEDWYPTQ